MARPTAEGRTCPAIKKDGSQCKLAAGFGTNHLGFGNCRFHAGRSKAKVEEALAEKVRHLSPYGAPREVDPHAALLEELYRTSGAVTWIEEEVNRVERSGALLEDRNIAAKWKRELRVERTHLVGIAKTCIDAGIAERQVRLAEEQGRLIHTVIQGVLRELGVADRPEVPGVVRRHLTSVAGGQSGQIIEGSAA